MKLIGMKLTGCRADGRVGLVLLIAAICLGCSPEPNTKDRYVPAADLARQAIEEVLVDWQAGRAPSPIDRLAVGIQVVDKQRKKGQSLEEYEILGEAPSEAARCFAVRVKLSGPGRRRKGAVCRVGIDPLWVFRQEDYESLISGPYGIAGENQRRYQKEPAKPKNLQHGEECRPDAGATW